MNKKYPKKTYSKVIRDKENLDPNLKLSITVIPIANDRLVREVALLHNRNIAEVENIISFIGRYTKQVIEAGTMETIMFPYFGKFTPNIKLLQSTVRRKRAIANKTYMLELALKGKNINFVPQINPISYDTETGEPESNSTPTSKTTDTDNSEEDVW